MIEKIHKYIHTILSECSSIEIQISGSRDLINRLDIALHKIIEEEEDKSKNEQGITRR